MHLHYTEEAGRQHSHKGVPVVMLHGGGPGASGLSNFRRNLPVFAERFRTLVVDQPGYGKSDKPPVQGNYFTFAADALAACSMSWGSTGSTWSATLSAAGPRSASLLIILNGPNGSC